MHLTAGISLPFLLILLLSLSLSLSLFLFLTDPLLDHPRPDHLVSVPPQERIEVMMNVYTIIATLNTAPLEHIQQQ